MNTENAKNVDWSGIADQYGTPAYIYDGDGLVGNFRELQAALHPGLEIFYSLKANPNRSVYELLRAAGAGAEVSSLAELRTALAVGTSPRDILFLGPGKSAEEIGAAVDARIYGIVCESFGELDLIERCARERGVRQRVLLRINPACSVAGARLTMGAYRQFGIDEAALLAAHDIGSRYQHAYVAGIQVYMGTRILDEEIIVKTPPMSWIWPTG